MRFTQRVKVMGAKSFSGDVDGTVYDSTKVFIEMGLDESKGTAKGYAGQELAWGDSSEYRKIAALPFPFEADVTIELVTTGKASRQRIVDLKPVGRLDPPMKQ